MAELPTDVFPNLIGFLGRQNIRRVSRQWEEGVTVANQQIIDTLFNRYPTRMGPTWEPIPTETLYDVVRAAIESNDVESIRMIISVYTGFTPISWKYLYPYITDERIAEIILPLVTDGYYRRKFETIIDNGQRYTAAYIQSIEQYVGGHIQEIANLRRLHLIPNTPVARESIQRFIDRISITSIQDLFTYASRKWGTTSTMVYYKRRYYFLKWLGDNGYLDNNPYLFSLYKDDPVLFEQAIRARGLPQLQMSGDTVSISPSANSRLYTHIVDTQAVNIYRTFVQGGVNIEERSFLNTEPYSITGPILQYLYDNRREQLQQMYEQVRDYIDQEVEDIFYPSGGDESGTEFEIGPLADMLDFLTDRVNPDTIILAASFEYLGLLDKYMDEFNYMAVALGAFRYHTVPHIPESVYITMMSKGIQYEYVAFYAEREDIVYTDYDPYIEDYPETMEIARRVLDENAEIPDDDRQYVENAIQKLRYDRWAEARNISDSVPPRSFWEPFLVTTLQYPWARGSLFILSQIVRFHPDDVSAEMLVNIIEPFSNRERRLYVWLLERLDIKGEIIDQVYERYNLE